MPNTNGNGPRTAVLYARVSTEEQARSGYSLAQQFEALREYAEREGYEVLEEVADPGQSGASLERPGMDRVRDLVASGGVCVVLAQDRDRFAREPAYLYLLREEFAEHGCALRSLNDRGDDSPEGQLADGILDQLAKYERAKIAERSRRGKLRKAREGKVIAGRLPDYGFRFNEARDNYVVDGEKMAVVRRIFYMIGVEGRSINAARKALDSGGVPPPEGGERWVREFIRAIVTDDVYKPHSYSEVKELVSPEVAARLDPEKCYGIWWFNRRRVIHTQISELSGNGRRYRKRTKTLYRPREEWIAVPVPDSGIPREWVDAAREATKDNRAPSSAGRRFWELSGGICYCGGCGRRIRTFTTRGGRGRKLYHYYHCISYRRPDKGPCEQKKNFPAHKVEEPVWEFVRSYLLSPEQLRQDLDRMIDIEREGLRGDPGREHATWVRKLSELDRKRSAYQDQQAEGLITMDELRAKLAALEEVRETARRELEALRTRRERIAELERCRDGILEHYAAHAPEALDSLTPEERHQLYKMLRLRVTLTIEGEIEVSGVFFGGGAFCLPESTQGGYNRRRSRYLKQICPPIRGNSTSGALVQLGFGAGAFLGARDRPALAAAT